MKRAYDAEKVNFVIFMKCVSQWSQYSADVQVNTLQVSIVTAQ